ncbi:outer membrane protein assembly factor BamB family protein [Microlunatus soli]|uniref:PQQ-like domain-containing protein n=1 Tax=Microlunatus soli TaxID=630515 RepID=A0A1H1X5F7_9ACTN|nr:PQQ-binding-like beta-propeller repeat protein [Microlunatus soli]SDT04595.1 PQQ-like domain-containing protein [Microlunatus soli]
MIATIVVLVIVALVLQLVSRLSGDETDSGSRPAPTRSSAPSVPERQAELRWKIKPAALRPKLAEAEFVAAIDGDFDGPYVTEQHGLWLTLTGTEDAEQTVLHAIDPATGKVRWQRPIDGALCTAEADPAGIICAEIVDRDATSGSGKRWRLQRLDPESGTIRRSVELNGWFSALHRSGNTVVALEQREPGPHAVLRGFDPKTLKQRWSRDLKDEPGQDEMFSENKVVHRKLPDQDRVLDRPRFRDVGPKTGHGSTARTELVALWAGGRTAFVRPDTGKLVMMPHCSRLVDDGKRLWCNEVAGAASYSYRGKLLHRIKGPRLAFPGDDGIGVDRNRPVFIDDGGAPVSVDLGSGKVGGAYAAPGAGSVWGMKTTPSVESVGRYTFLIGEAGTMLVDPERDKIIWTNTEITQSDQPLLQGTEVMFGYSTFSVVDVRNGKQRAEVDIDGLYIRMIGDRLAGVGPDEISLQRLP